MPFYLRTGKRLGRRVTEVAVVFKRAPHLPFNDTQTEDLTQNALVIRVQPDEGVTIRFGSKVPGTAMEIRDVNMDFAYGGTFTEASPEAYERLILDVLLGDPPLFPQHEEVELSWKILDPILEYWAKHGKPDRMPPAPGARSPRTKMLARDGRVWRRPDDRALDTNSAAIAAEFVKERTLARQPGDGHGDDDGDRRRRGRGRRRRCASARHASHEHPARVIGRDPRRRPRQAERQRPDRDRRRLVR